MDAPPNWHAPDTLLQGLLELVNKGGLHFRITILVNGALLSGAVVSAREYTNALEQVFSTSLDKEVTEAPESVLEAVKQLTANLYPTLAKDATATIPFVQYIHLVDVTHHHSTAEKTGFSDYPFPFWRFRLSEVDAWMMGG
jgi:hypothetical protein